MLSCVEVVDRMMHCDFWDKTKGWYYIPEFDPFKDREIPDPRSYRSFDEVMNTFKSLFDMLIHSFIKTVVELRDERLYDIAPLPLLSALVEGCLETGRDVTQFGMPYTQHSIVLAGLSHAADSLAVIKKLCFEEKTINLSDLVDAVRNNWEGKEPLRQLVRSRAAAYGNDIDYVDDIAKEIVKFFVESIKRHRQEVKTKIKFAPGIASFDGYTMVGRMAGATADGRLAREPVSSNASPSVGRAANGQTAALNSYLKLPHIDLPTAGPLDLAMAPRKDIHERLMTLLKTFIAGKGSCLTISVNDTRKLIAAQKEPEKYRDLKVRVGGWEAYFVDLPPHFQDFLIKKAEQYGE
jgi:formate C-acetyltransferase